MWVTEDNRIQHSYYQKPMKTPLVLMERSGTSTQQKFQILTNELVRRLSNIQHEEISQAEINIKIEQYIQELRNSGYNQKQARELISCGIRGWKTKIRKRKRDQVPFYRLAEDTVEERLKKKLIEKETWYKDRNEDEEESGESPIKKRRTIPQVEKLPSKNKRRTKKTVIGGKKEVKSIIFIPHTKDSSLAKVLRERETKIQEVTGDRIKIVERAGKKLEDLVSNKDPWKGADCGRSNCFLCNTKILTGKNLKVDCTKRNIIYEIKCISCEERALEEILEKSEGDEEVMKKMKKEMRIHKYIGESSRSAYERGYEHLDKLASLNSQSHMLRHMVMRHEGEEFEKVKWGMNVLSFKRTPFERQLEEAVLITRESDNHEILNSKSKYNQCTLPRLVTRLGDTEREQKELEQQIKIDKKK